MSNQEMATTAIQAMNERSLRPAIEIVSCISNGQPTRSLVLLAEALQRWMTVRLTLICEETAEAVGHSSLRTIVVPKGTKLSKLRIFSKHSQSPLVCIVDPDMELDISSAVDSVLRALASQQTDVDAIVYGVVAAQATNSWLAQLIELDKLWSHRVLRPSLWALGVGITLPGQFLIVSSKLLQRLDASVDTFLDDLYLGLLVRESLTARPIRLPAVVGRERVRCSWFSLLAQRIRWMKGFFALLCAFWRRPPAAAYLLVHYGAYHALPIVALASGIICVSMFPLGTAAVFAGMVILISFLMRRSPITVAVYCFVFPCLHLLATLAAGLPFNRVFLTRR